MTDSDTIRRRRGGNVTLGILMVTLGLWFFLRNLGFDLPGLGELWPIFTSLAGATFLIAFVTGKSHNAGLVFLGTAGILVGLFFFTFTVGPLEWWRMEDYWPAFPLIAGSAFVATWVAGRFRESGLLVPAAVGLLAGVVGFSFTLGWLEEWVMPVIENGWPLVLVATGLLMVFRGKAVRWQYAGDVVQLVQEEGDRHGFASMLASCDRVAGGVRGAPVGVSRMAGDHRRDERAWAL